MKLAIVVAAAIAASACTFDSINYLRLKDRKVAEQAGKICQPTARCPAPAIYLKLSSILGRQQDEGSLATKCCQTNAVQFLNLQKGVCCLWRVVYLTDTERNRWIHVCAMALEIALFGLIAQLDKVERAFVRKCLGGEELLFFTIAHAKKGYSDAQMRAQFPALSEAGYATLRSRLQDSIAEAIGEYHRRRRPETKVQTVVHAADAFMNKGLPAQAQRVLAKAIKLAIRYETFTHLDFMQGLRGRLPFFMVGNKLAAAKWPLIDDLLAQLESRQSAYIASKRWLLAAMELKQGGVEGRKTKAMLLSSQLPTMAADNHAKTTLLLARSKWICAWFLGETAAFEDLLDWAIALSEREAWLWGDWEAFDVIEAAFFTKAIVRSANLEFGPALNLLDQFEMQALAARRFHLPELIEIRRLLKGRQLLSSGDAKAIKRGLKVILKEIGKPKIVHDYLYGLCLQVLEFCISSLQFDLAKPWLAIINHAKLDLKRTSSVIGSYLLELVFWFSANEMDEVENCIRRMVYFAKTRNSDHHFVEILAAGFKSLINQNTELASAIDDFLSGLESHPNMQEFQVYFAIFDLKGYLVQLRSRS